MLKQMSLIVSVLSASITLISCSSSSDETRESTVLHSTPSAFNVYTKETFSNSTCKNLPIEVPEGIFVAVDGKSDALGTQEDPLDLVTALSYNSPVKAGQTVWIDEGVYVGTFVSNLNGKDGSPIEIRPLPGKRVIIDSNNGDSSNVQDTDSALVTKGSWCNYYGLELLSSDTNRGSITEVSPNINAKGGISTYGVHTNIYNFIIHDNLSSGSGFWKTATDSTMHGNIIYNNGASAKGRGHGHGIYAQNTNGFKVISNNIIFFGYQTGLHPYSTKSAPLNNFTIKNNVWFLAGASDPRDNQQKTNLIVHTQAGIENMVIESNKGYTQVNRGSSLNSRDTIGSVSFINNYLVERLELYNRWNPMKFIGNTIYGNLDGDGVQDIEDISDNVFESSRPSEGKKVFVDANEIDVRRGRIVIYNYDNDDNVSVNLGSILKKGEAYRIHSVFGLFDAPILSGVYNGEDISLPMGTVEPPQPNGDPNGIDENDGPKKKFGTFIVTHGGCQ